MPQVPRAQALLISQNRIGRTSDARTTPLAYKRSCLTDADNLQLDSKKK